MTISNISSKATGLILTKFHVKPPGTEGTYSDSPGHMTSIVIMPIYGKKILKSSTQEPIDKWP